MQGVDRPCRDATKKEMEDLKLVLAHDTPLDKRVSAIQITRPPPISMAAGEGGTAPTGDVALVWW